MRAEIFLKSGRKITVNKVVSIRNLEKSKMICIDYEKEVNGFDFTTCDEPSMGFYSESIDMIKLVL